MQKIFWTDGSCSGNPGPGGFGVVCLETDETTGNDYVDYIYDEHCQSTTNNREELKAILHVLKIAVENPDVHITIYSDSAYAVNAINTWMHNWARNGWINSKKLPVENKDLITEIYKYYTTKFHRCQVLKCHGHNGTVGNELADALATGNKTKYLTILKKNNIDF